MEIVHTNLSGPTKTREFYGERYFMILVDDFTRMMWVAFLKDKFKAFDKFKVFNNRVENEYGFKIKCLRSNRGGEFNLNEFNILCEVNVIKKQLSGVKTLEMNAIAKRRNISIIEVVRAPMMFENNFSNTFWRDAIKTIVYIMNKIKIR